MRLSNSIDPLKATCTTWNAAIKIHPGDILHDKNHLYEIILVHLTSNTALQTRKHRPPDIEF